VNALPLTTLKLMRLERAESHLKFGWPPGVLPSLAAEAQALRRELPPDILMAYDRFARGGSEAVVAVRAGVCQGCEAKLAPETLNRLHDGSQAVRCQSCGRFLYEADPPALESLADQATDREAST
jgi:hypothetical protein